MLSFKLEGDILEVTEVMHSFYGTKRTYWYYDIKTWRKSSYGKEGDPPDTKMLDDEIDWVIKYYLPKVNK